MLCCCVAIVGFPKLLPHSPRSIRFSRNMNSNWIPVKIGKCSCINAPCPMPVPLIERWQTDHNWQRTATENEVASIHWPLADTDSTRFFPSLTGFLFVHFSPLRIVWFSISIRFPSLQSARPKILCLFRLCSPEYSMTFIYTVNWRWSFGG